MTGHYIFSKSTLVTIYFQANNTIKSSLFVTALNIDFNIKDIAIEKFWQLSCDKKTAQILKLFSALPGTWVSEKQR